MCLYVILVILSGNVVFWLSILTKPSSVQSIRQLVISSAAIYYVSLLVGIEFNLSLTHIANNTWWIKFFFFLIKMRRICRSYLMYFVNSYIMLRRSSALSILFLLGDQCNISFETHNRILKRHLIFSHILVNNVLSISFCSS